MRDREKTLTWCTADDTSSTVCTKVTLVADTDESFWSDVGIADWAFPVAFVAETADGDASLLATHNKIAARKC